MSLVKNLAVRARRKFGRNPGRRPGGTDNFLAVEKGSEGTGRFLCVEETGKNSVNPLQKV